MTEILEEKQFCSESECPSWGGWSIWSVCDYPGMIDSSTVVSEVKNLGFRDLRPRIFER